MAILVDADTRVICQGMTGHQASYYTEQAINYGTQIVGGVTPGKGGSQHLDLPVFDTVAEAVRETGADASMIFVPAQNAADAIIESIEAGLSLLVCVTERIPVLDMVRVKRVIEDTETRLIGPDCSGIITPDECKIGIMPRHIFRRGNVGIVSRSSTLIYEAVAQVTAEALGQSTCIGIGPDPVHGMGFPECLELFLADPETKGIILIGEIEGIAEEQAADYLKADRKEKPVVAYIAGRYAPPERRTGYGDAIIEHNTEGVSQKVEALRSAGVHIVESPARIGSTVASLLGKQ